ncbi:acyl-CoA dehydrogenase [Actinoalloteichus caeruleus]|uniref:acyl-CoA dehydrogenase family protein n=1 Tax=Actinoalloteichus cyanogriseus TaxID=2893586 RepID=UPI003BB958F5
MRIEDDPEFRALLVALSQHEVFHDRPGLDHQRRCALTYDRLRVVGEHLPPGSELLARSRRLFMALEWAAVTDPPLFLALTLHVCLSLGAVVEFGGDRARRHVRDLDEMRAFGALLVTEVGRGNSHLGIRTVADHDPATGGFVLTTPDETARKFMPNVGLPGVPKTGVVYARLRGGGRDHGVFPFVAPIRTAEGTPEGVHVVPLPEAPLLPLDYALIQFDALRLPRDALLSDDAHLDDAGVPQDPLGGGQRRLRRSLDIRHGAWVASAAALAAVTRASVVNALRHNRHRTTASPLTVERPVLDHRAHRRPLALALADSYALTRLVDRVKTAWSGGARADADDPAWRPGPGLNRTCGLVKATASALAARVIGECGLRCGAHGMFRPGRWVEYQGLAHMLGPAAGDGYLITLEAARALAGGDHYAPPPAQGPTGPPTTPTSWTALVAARERSLHERLTSELGVARRHGQSGFDAWNDRSPLGVDLAEAHAATLLVESALAPPDRSVPARAARLAATLGALHASKVLLRHADFYLTEGLLTPEALRGLAGGEHALVDQAVADLDAVPDLLDLPPGSAGPSEPR